MTHGSLSGGRPQLETMQLANIHNIIVTVIEAPVSQPRMAFFLPSLAIYHSHSNKLSHFNISHQLLRESIPGYNPVTMQR